MKDFVIANLHTIPVFCYRRFWGGAAGRGFAADVAAVVAAGLVLVAFFVVAVLVVVQFVAGFLGPAVFVAVVAVPAPLAVGFGYGFVADLVRHHLAAVVPCFFPYHVFYGLFFQGFLN